MYYYQTALLLFRVNFIIVIMLHYYQINHHLLVMLIINFNLSFQLYQEEVDFITIIPKIVLLLFLLHHYYQTILLHFINLAIVQMTLRRFIAFRFQVNFDSIGEVIIIINYQISLSLVIITVYSRINLIKIIYTILVVYCY